MSCRNLRSPLSLRYENQLIKRTVLSILNMRQFIITILFVIYWALCFAQNTAVIDKFRKEIPTWKDGDTDLFYNLSQQKAAQLKLDVLQNGYDSLQIRIWYNYPFTTLRKLFIIKRANSVWSATSYRMSVDWNPTNLTDSVMSKRKKTVSPKSGWADFVHKLLTLQIIQLPNMRDIPGLEDWWSDGENYNVEVSTKQLYRFYGYHLPEKFQDKYWQAKNMAEILKLVETEFSVERNIKWKHKR